MPASVLWRAIPLVLATALFVPAALAQHVILDAPGLIPKNKAPPPAPRTAPTVWPRLDPGAILCRTADDLDRHAANTVARVSGTSTMPADCHLIAQPTGIQIVSREGLGRTQVKVTGSGENGWTNAWLPEKAPPAR